MYDNFRRRRHHDPDALGRGDRLPAGIHEGTGRDFGRRHAREAAEAARAGPAGRAAFAARLLERTADSRNVRAAIDHLAAHGGRAAGPDGLALVDLDDRERWELARALGGAIRSGSYRPGPERRVAIPKSSGKGTRTITVQNAGDRAVQRAVVQSVQPFLDPTFAPTSYGFRPGRGREDALAKAEALTTANGLRAWVAEDVKDAFDRVPRERLLDVLRRRVPADDFLGLVDVMIAGEGKRGLRQGGSLSPLLLNVYLDHVLDRPWRRAHPGTPLVRVADDLLALCREPGQARDAREALVRLLRPAGMPLKGTAATAVRGLAAGETASWLGYAVGHSTGGMDAYLPEGGKLWFDLEEALASAHLEPDAPLRARATVEGWVGQLGPCLPNADVDAVHARVAGIGRRHAFEELPTAGEFRALWLKAYDRWVVTREEGGDGGED